MKQRYKHIFPKIERLCFLRGPCKVVIKNKEVEFRDASLPGHELGNRGIQMSWLSQNDCKKGIGL
jgi:hypothetical protein